VLDWFKNHGTDECYGVLELFKEELAKMKAGQPSIFDPPEPKLNRSTLARGGWNQRFPFGRFGRFGG
jgi:hypothetical protein